MPTLRQTLAGAVDFDGMTPATGLFAFDLFDDMTRTTRVEILAVGYAAEVGAQATYVEAYAVLPGGLATERLLIGRALAAQITGPSGDGDVRFCGIALPREPATILLPGLQWQIEVRSAGKQTTATAIVDYVLHPYPDTSPQDGAP